MLAPLFGYCPAGLQSGGANNVLHGTKDYFLRLPPLRRELCFPQRQPDLRLLGLPRFPFIASPPLVVWILGGRGGPPSIRDASCGRRPSGWPGVPCTSCRWPTAAVLAVLPSASCRRLRPFWSAFPWGGAGSSSLAFWKPSFSQAFDTPATPCWSRTSCPGRWPRGRFAGQSGR